MEFAPLLFFSFVIYNLMTCPEWYNPDGPVLSNNVQLTTFKFLIFDFDYYFIIHYLLHYLITIIIQSSIYITLNLIMPLIVNLKLYLYYYYYEIAFIILIYLYFKLKFHFNLIYILYPYSIPRHLFKSGYSIRYFFID